MKQRQNKNSIAIIVSAVFGLITLAGSAHAADKYLSCYYFYNAGASTDKVPFASQKPVNSQNSVSAETNLPGIDLGANVPQGTCADVNRFKFVRAYTMPNGNVTDIVISASEAAIPMGQVADGMTSQAHSHNGGLTSLDLKSNSGQIGCYMRIVCEIR